MEEDTLDVLKDSVKKLESEVATLKAERLSTYDVGTRDNEEQGKTDDVAHVIEGLRHEVSDLKVTMEKAVEGLERAGLTQASSNVIMVPAMVPKGIPAPAGMSPEQLQEFKKQTLQINGLQQKMKDLEAKLTEATAAIKKGNERAGEMEEKSTENVKDLYATIDQINNSLSEKIAQQRVEMQKMAGDTPKQINYDPFNYGEAYSGDFVDFQARKRITEIKLLLQSLQANMNSMRDSVKISPSIDLGYKIVRLDQLVASTGFKEAIENGEATTEDGVLITQPSSRDPGRIEMPRKEIFQTSEDLESKWAITDSIMQTMYRLEVELGELQKLVGSSDVSSNRRILEDLQTSIRQLKEKQIDSKFVKRIVEESVGSVSNKRLSIDEHSRFFSRDASSREDFISRSAFEDALKSLKTLQVQVDSWVKRMKALESNFTKRSEAAATKTQGAKKSACLSCDRGIQSPFSRSMLYDPGQPPDAQALAKIPPRLRYVLNRTFNIDTNKVRVDVYSIPRPCGAAYPVYWPVMKGVPQSKISRPSAHSSHIKCGYIRGVDGRYYIGDDEPVYKAECKKRPPWTVMAADMVLKTPAVLKTGGKVVREVHFQGKQATIKTSVPTGERQKASVKEELIVGGEQKSPATDKPVEEKPEPGAEVEARAEAEVEAEVEVQAQAEVEAQAEAEVEKAEGEGEVQDEEAPDELQVQEPTGDENEGGENENESASKGYIVRSYQNSNNSAQDDRQQGGLKQPALNYITDLVSMANSCSMKIKADASTPISRVSGNQVTVTKGTKYPWEQRLIKKMKVIERRAGVTHNSYKQDQMKNCSQNATRAISRRCQPPEAVPKNRKLQNRKDQQKAKDVPGEQGKACPKSQREVTGQDGEKSRSPPRRMSAIKLQQEAQRKEKVQLQISQQMIIESKLLKLEMKFEREKRHRQAHLQYWRQHEERRNGFVPQQLQQEPRNDQPQLSMLQQLSVLSQPAQTGADARFQNRDNRSFHLQREEHFKLKSISDWLDSDGDSKQKRNPGLHKNIQRCPLTNAKMTEGPCEMAGSTMQSEQGKLPEKNVGLTSSKSKSNRNKVAGMVSSETKTEHFSQESRAGENGVENNRQPRSKSDTDRSMKSLVRDPAKGIQSPGIQSSGIQSPGIQSSGIQSPGIQSSGMPSPPNFSYPSSSTEHFSCSPENECLVEGSENQRRSKMSDKLDSINAFLSSTLSGEDTLLKVFKCGARKSRSDIHSYKTFANASLRTNNSKCCGEVEKETWKLTPNKLNSSPNIVTSDSSKFNKTVDSSQPIMSADQRNTFMVSGDGTEHTCCQEYVTDSKNVGFNTACLDQYTAAPDAISASSTCSELYSKYSSIAVNPEAMAWSPVGTVYTSNFVREAGERMATADRVPCTGHVASEKNTQEGDNERQRTFPSEFEDNLSLAGTSVSCKTTGSDCSPRACDTDFWSHVVRSTINPEVATNNMCPVEVNPRTFDTNTNASASSLTLSLRDTFTEDGDTVSNVSDISSDVGSVAPYSNNFTSSWVKDPKRFGITHPPDGNCGSATSQKPVTSLPSKNTDRLSQTNSPRLVRRNHRAPVHIQFSEGIQMVSVKRLDQHLHARDPQQHGHLLNHFKFPTICIQEVSRANLTTSPEHKSRIKGATDQQRSMESSSHSQGGRHTSLQRPEKQASPPDSTRDKMVNYINQRLEMLDKQKVKLVDIKRTKRKRPARTAPERCVTTSQAGELNNCHSNSVNKSQSNVQTKLEVQGTASMMYIEKAAFLS